MTVPDSRESDRLPVRRAAEDLLTTLRRDRRLVLAAPTGSGKTTQVPRVLLDSGLTGDGEIVVLQPRRLATRLVAERVAAELGEEAGAGRVGWQTRHDRRVGAACRVRFVTEGLFLRELLGRRGSSRRRPLPAAVVLDEFHERSIDADLVLGLLWREWESSRHPLLVVMSATLDVHRLGSYLDCTPVTVEGRLHPVEVRHLARRSSQAPWELAADRTAALMAAHEGDALVFMPGAGEIGRTVDATRAALRREGVDADLHPLHGGLPPRDQDAAVRPSTRRRVVVATNVAETSITIPGIRIVVDSGLARIHRFDAARGINALRVEPISRAAADQRAGRAGRTAPGVCERLWTALDDAQRPERDTPEIRRVELSETMLQLATSSASDEGSLAVDEFPWLDAPDPDAVARGRAVLDMLGAVDDRGRVTPIGEVMVRFPVHPRVGRLLADAARRGCLSRALTWAALIGERDLLVREEPGRLVAWQRPGEPASDLTARESAWHEAAAVRFDPRRCETIGVSSTVAREVDRSRRQLESIARRLGLFRDGGDRAVGDSGKANEGADLARSLLTGFVDHVAVRLDATRAHCAMRGRRRVSLARTSVVRRPGPLVAVELREIGRGDDRDVSLALATEVQESWLQALFPERCAVQEEAVWNDDLKATERVDVRRFDGIETGRTTHGRASGPAAAAALVERIQSGALRLRGWDERVEEWIRRTRLVGEVAPERELITYDDEETAVVLHEIVGDAVRFNQVETRPCLQAVKDALSWDDQRYVEAMAPESLPLPSGRRLRLTYPESGPPVGRARIQELYGLTETPRIARGRQVVLLEILAPNHRPVQRTTDLAGFWERLYPELRKELRRRYPKHEWR